MYQLQQQQLRWDIKFKQVQMEVTGHYIVAQLHLNKMVLYMLD